VDGGVSDQTVDTGGFLHLPVPLEGHR
jgi:hypothetical protein